MTIRVQAPLSPEPVGSHVWTPKGIGRVVSYRCPGGVIEYVVDVDEQLNLSLWRDA